MYCSKSQSLFDQLIKFFFLVINFTFWIVDPLWLLLYALYLGPDGSLELVDLPVLLPHLLQDQVQLLPTQSINQSI